MIDIETEYSKQKSYYNKDLNGDKKLFKNSNDEPTPIECIEEMITKIPESIFQNKDLKILDPCCGCGNFFIPIVKKLRNNIPLKNIIENILYFNDINTDRINIVKKVFKENKYKLNITKEDFLEFDNHTMYDLIVANPPYAKFLDNGKRTSKNHNLIGPFLTKSLEVLKDNGILLFITPDNWMSYSNRNKLIEELTSYQIHHLNIHTAKKYFKKIGSSFTWYVIEKTSFYKKIEIQGTWKNKIYVDFVDSQKRKFIPLFYNSIIKKILEKTIDKKNRKFIIETSSDLHRYTKKKFISNEQKDDYVHKLIHTPSQTCWSNKPHKYQDGYKVFISTTTYYKVFVDNCGMTQSIVFIRCTNKEEADNICKVLQHPLYQFINNICRWGNFNNICILKSFPYCDIYDDVYKTFNINNEEQFFIENN
jgi:adenine-specific DNA-methyltransferase